MNKNIPLIVLLLLFGLSDGVRAEALSETAWQQTLSAKPTGDATLGQSLYGERGCAGCHGAQGIPDNREWPVLAGQRPLYLYKMLLDYRDKRLGDASAAPMAGVAAGLSDEDMAHLAAWLGGLRRPAAPGISGGVPSIAKGDRSRLIPPCEACHGANGQGWDLQPAVSGQNRAYLSAVLYRFKTGERSNDINGGMAQFARKLNEDEIRQLSIFYGR